MPSLVLCEDKAPGQPESRSEPAGFQRGESPGSLTSSALGSYSPCRTPNKAGTSQTSPPATWGPGQTWVADPGHITGKPTGFVDFAGDPSSPALRYSASEPSLGAGAPVTPGGTANASPSAKRQATGFAHGSGGRPKVSLLDKVRAIARGKMRTSGRVQPEQDDDGEPVASTRSGPPAQKRQSFLSRLSFRSAGRRSQSSGAAASPSASSAKASQGAETAPRHVKFRMQVSARFVVPYSKVYGMNPRFFQYNRKGEMELTDAGIAEEMKKEGLP